MRASGRNSPLIRLQSLRWQSFAAASVVLSLVIGCTPPDSQQPLVEDHAGLLDAAQRDRIELFHELLRQDFDIDYRMLTTEEADDIDAYSAEVFERIGAGELSATGRGLLLVIDPAQDRVRLEVGYALEGPYPDAFIAYIEQRQMVPFFRANRVADGILSTTELIVTRAQRTARNAGFDDEAWLAGSGGAGASTSARIGQGTAPEAAGDPRALSDQATPAAILAEYFARMQDRDANPELEIYTPDTRKMLRGWVMTPAQMDNVVGTFRRCSAEATRTDPSGRRAVIRYPPGQRECSPWFFENIGGVWALDLTMMQTAIRFGRTNAWRFDPGVEHPYEFAFADWTFDSNGFPRDN